MILKKTIGYNSKTIKGLKPYITSTRCKDYLFNNSNSRFNNPRVPPSLVARMGGTPQEVEIKKRKWIEKFQLKTYGKVLTEKNKKNITEIYTDKITGFDNFLFAFFFNRKFRNILFPYYLKRQSEIKTVNEMKVLSEHLLIYSNDDPEKRREVDYRRISKCLWEMRFWIWKEYNSDQFQKHYHPYMKKRKILNWIHNQDVKDKVDFRINSNFKSRIYAEVVSIRKRPTKSLFPYFVAGV